MISRVKETVNMAQRLGLGFFAELIHDDLCGPIIVEGWSEPFRCGRR
jgi:hypothetical protein